VNLFSKHFNSAYCDSNVDYIPFTVPYLDHDLSKNCFFDKTQVENGLSKLKNNKFVGPDGLSGEFLYAIRSSFCFPLCLLFRKSLDSGVCPEIFKLSSITLILKSGDTSDIGNYRPISILGYIPKLFESLVLS
jgi:hypothetical protein